MPDDKKTKVVKTPAGRYVEAPEEAVESAKQFGTREATPEEVKAERQRVTDEERFGGLLGAAAAGVESFASGATGGLYDVVGRAAFGDRFTEARRGQKEHQPVVSTLAEAGGTIAGPGKLAAGIGKSVATKTGSKAAGLVAEGAVAGVGPGVSETFVSKDPVTLERLLGNISSNALLGGGVNLAFGAGQKVLDKVIGGARKGLDAAAKGKAAGEPVAARAKAADDVMRHHADSAADGRWLIADVDEKAKAALTKSNTALRNIADTPDTFRKSPGQAMKALEKEENALTKIRDAREEGLAKLAKEDAGLADEVRLDLDTLPDDAAETVLTGKAAQRYGSYADVKVARKSPKVTVTREEAAEFAEALSSGKVQGMRAQAFAQLDDSIARVQGLRKQLDDALAPAPVAKESFLEKAVQGTVFGAAVAALPAMPLGAVVAPAIGAKVAGFATDVLFKRFGDTAAGAAARTSKALDSLMAAGPVAQKVAVPLSTSVLSSVRFAEEEKRGPGRPAKKDPDPEAGTLAGTFKARERELRSQVESGFDGKPRMTATARQKVGQNLAGVKAADPVLADQIETATARRVEYLASKLPKRPDFIAANLGPDTWRPSRLEMMRFARQVAAAEDPAGVEERLAAGRISPEDAEAYQAVYPERFEALKLDIIQRFGKLKKQLPYAQRLALSMFTGVPLVPALQPAILRVLQGQYADEPGSEGGTTAPTAQPAFGSISKEKPTPAQSRAGG